MRKALLMLGAVAMLALSSCGYFSQFSNLDHSQALRVGMSREQVRKIMGEPLKTAFASDDVWYYYVETRWHDGQSTRDECMPVVFEKEKLKGWGAAWYNRERLTKKAYDRPQIEGLK